MTTQTIDGLEPRFSLPPSTPLSSKTELVIGGLKVYIYGLDEVNLNRSPDRNGDIAVLYMAHNRTRTYRVMEDMAHEILHRYRMDTRKGKRLGLIALTMNMRNHGDREIFPQANTTWKEGNENHAMDLTSMISGCAQDFKLVVDYLPCYLPQFSRFYNIMAGVSLGGHTAWRIASLAAPGQFCAYTMIVGCPNLTPLLLSRLGIDTEDTLKYDDLEPIMTPEQQRRWPRALAEMIYRDDVKVTDHFPTNVPLLLCNGVHDKLVPAKYTAAWLEERRRKEVPGSEQDITFYVQENTGHSCTKEMIAMLAGWLGDILNPHTPRSTL